MKLPAHAYLDELNIPYERLTFPASVASLTRLWGGGRCILGYLLSLLSAVDH